MVWVNQSNVQANQVIVFGPNDGVFVYSGTPALGNPPIAYVSNAAADPYGNPLTVAGIVTLDASGDWSSLLAGGIAMHSVGTGGNTPIANAAILASIATLTIQPGTTTAQSLAPQIKLLSDAATPVIDLLANTAVTGNLSVTASVTATGGTQANPSLVTTDTWHTITLDSGWTVPAGRAAPQYRLEANGSIALTGAATHASFTSALALNSGAPLSAALHAVNFQSSSGDINTAGLEFNTGGVFVAEPSQAAGNTMVFLDGLFFWPGK